LAVTVLVGLYPVEPGGVVSPTLRQPELLESPQSAAKTVVPSVPGGADRDEPIADPFAVVVWHTAPRPVIAPPRPAASIPEPLPPPVVSMPTLPYQYLGRMDQDGVEYFYLGKGDEVVVARAGDTLAEGYRLTSASSTRLEFEHLTSGTRLFLPTLTNGS
jgi:hypothetical protein